MDTNEFRKTAHELVDWMADYLEQIEEYPVKSQVSPGSIYEQIPKEAPEKGEEMNEILADFQSIIMPGITHWQHPSFFAYFPANSSPPSLLAEMLMSTLASQCMLWETSPAATELEERVMEWLGEMIGLPSFFKGVLQNSASECTLIALLCAREKYTNYQSNITGLRTGPLLKVYASAQIHSSIEKAVRIAGMGSENLHYIEADDQFAMDASKLETAILADKKAGNIPCCVIAAIGTTSSTGVDPIKEIAAICKEHNIWLHVDAAYAGTALVLPEYRHFSEGIEEAQSIVFNPHKWMFTNFDCSAYFIRDKDALLRTFSILPEYLKTASHGKVNNYCDWGIQLGRRFRALKLWFVLRNFGQEGIREKLRLHIRLAKDLYRKIEAEPNYEILALLNFNLICFRYKPENISSEETLKALNQKLLQNLNKSGKLFISHTSLNGRYTLRIVVAQTNVEARHVENAWTLIKNYTREL